MKAFKTGDNIYKPIYAFINQFHFNMQKHPANPFADREVSPHINKIIYMPIKKNKHWKTKLQKLFVLGLIPNHPDISTKTFTQTMDDDSKNNLMKAFVGVVIVSFGVGISNEKKSA